MATQTVSLAPINDTDANFRLWGKAISDQMALGGWVKTTDTGQIDWATVVKPAVNIVGGFEIWRSNDATASVNQIYLKIEYATGSNTNSPNIFVTVGFASNGTGTLTGNISTRQTNGAGAATSSASLFPCNLAAGTGYVSMMMFSGQSSAIYIGIERTLNSSLADKDEVLFIFGKYTNSTGLLSQVISRLEGTYPVETAPTAQAVISTANAVQSGTVGFSLQFGQRGGFTNPSKNVFGSVVANVGAAQTVIGIESYGTTRNYIVNVLNSSVAFTANSQSVLSRFE